MALGCDRVTDHIGHIIAQNLTDKTTVPFTIAQPLNHLHPVTWGVVSREVHSCAIDHSTIAGHGHGLELRCPSLLAELGRNSFRLGLLDGLIFGHKVLVLQIAPISPEHPDALTIDSGIEKL